MRKRLIKFITLFIIILCLCSCSDAKAKISSYFSIQFIDVGQGDAALVECDGHYMLIDGGDISAGKTVYQALEDKRIRHLDILAISHLHQDHIGGLKRALSNVISIDLAISNSDKSNLSCFRDLESEIINTCKKKKITIPHKGERPILMSDKLLYLTLSDITEDVVIIKINRSYYPGITSLELYDVTRGCWKRKIESVESAKYAFATYKGEVVEVYKINYWCPASELHRETIAYNPERHWNRIGFFGSVADKAIREKFVGKSVKNFFKWGEADPVKLIKAGYN